jgi:hypothetical protein
MNPINWKSGNKKIDDFIQEMRLDIKNINSVLFEWIPYNQFSKINEISRDNFMSVYSAIWKDGSLCYDNYSNEYIRYLNKEVTLRYLHNSQNTIELLLNKVQNFLNFSIFSEFIVMQ